MNQTGKKSVLVFSGFNQRAVIAFLRTLEGAGVDYSIIAASENDTIFDTKYKERVAVVRKKLALDIDDLLFSISIAKKKSNAEKFLVAPSTEALNRFLLDHRQVFEDAGCEVPLVNKTLYEEISDKHRFGRLCKEHGIVVPGEYESIEQITLPCVAKPKTYVSSDGNTYNPMLLYTSADLKTFSANYKMEDFYFQEYIKGESMYLLYYFYRGGKVVKYSQRNLLQQPAGKSIIAAESSMVHNQQELQAFEMLFKDLSYRGLVMVEVKKYKGRYYMIEANPRFWGPSQLFVDAGKNLFENFLEDNDLLHKMPRHDQPSGATKYFWHGGYLASADAIAYHGIDKKDFEGNFSDWLAIDIYNREDTRDLYKSELEGNA